MHQHGYHVERRFGWDTHGLPVEYEIDKTLGIKGPDDVEKMGIEAYNLECRKIVMRYSKVIDDLIASAFLNLNPFKCILICIIIMFDRNGKL